MDLLNFSRLQRSEWGWCFIEEVGKEWKVRVYTLVEVLPKAVGAKFGSDNKHYVSCPPSAATSTPLPGGNLGLEICE